LGKLTDKFISNILFGFWEDWVWKKGFWGVGGLAQHTKTRSSKLNLLLMLHLTPYGVLLVDFQSKQKATVQVSLAKGEVWT